MAVNKFTEENFEAEVLQAEGTVLVDFYADWCGPCKMLSPVVDAFAESHTDIKVGKLNTDENMAIAEKYNVMSIPTLIVFKGGQVIAKEVGVIPESKIEEITK